MNDTQQSNPSSHTHAMPVYRPLLYGFAMLSVIAVLGLLALGGTVTSKTAGMAVPDWPQTFDYNMFLFPISMWKGGVFWEHTHRLWASGVGFMAIILCVWLWITEKNRRWMSWLGTGLLVMVIIQGILGGIRVTEIDWRFGIVHGILGQLYFCFVILACAALGKRWLDKPAADVDAGKLAKPVRMGWILLGVLLVQLSLGAAMRHSGAGLSVPDFPTFYGSLVPPTSQQQLDDAIIEHEVDVQHDKNGDVVHFKLWHVYLHTAHRLWAIAVIVHVLLLVKALKDSISSLPNLSRPVMAMLGLLLVQLTLGMLVIWTGKHPEISTAHQFVGAVFLGLATLIQIRMMRLRYLANHQIYADTAATPRDTLSQSVQASGTGAIA